MEGDLALLRRKMRVRRVSKQLRITPSSQENEFAAQTEPQAWLPASMLHGEPLMDNAFLRDFQKGEGTYVADALERSLLLPVDMAELKNLRRQEVFLSMKRYLGMVRLSMFVTLLAFVPWLLIYILLVSIGRRSHLQTGKGGQTLEQDPRPRV